MKSTLMILFIFSMFFISIINAEMIEVEQGPPGYPGDRGRTGLQGPPGIPGRSGDRPPYALYQSDPGPRGRDFYQNCCQDSVIQEIEDMRRRIEVLKNGR